MSEKKKSGISRLLEFGGCYRYLTVIACILSGISSILMLCPFLCFWMVLRDVLAALPDLSVVNVQVISNYGWMALALAICGFIFYAAALLFSHLGAFHTAKNMQSLILHHLSTLPLGFFSQNSSGKLRKIINENTSQTENFLAHQLPDMTGSAVTAVTMLVMLLFFDWRLGGLCIVLLGGVDISTVDPETLLKDYAIVFQDVVLFNDTIMGNIRLGRKDATDDEVMAAAKAARCDEFVQRLPEGYQTMVGENGSTLSGGERQRISIARALLKNAPIVLLDEATASLDVENETSLQTALFALLKNKTVLVIAHPMRTVLGADHVVVLADGHVAEEGTPEQLIEQDGMFRRMVELQKESSNWQIGGNQGSALRDILQAL